MHLTMPNNMTYSTPTRLNKTTGEISSPSSLSPSTVSATSSTSSSYASCRSSPPRSRSSLSRSSPNRPLPPPPRRIKRTSCAHNNNCSDGLSIGSIGSRSGASSINYTPRRASPSPSPPRLLRMLAPSHNANNNNLGSSNNLGSRKDINNLPAEPDSTPLLDTTPTSLHVRHNSNDFNEILNQDQVINVLDPIITKEEGENEQLQQQRMEPDGKKITPSNEYDLQKIRLVSSLNGTTSSSSSGGSMENIIHNNSNHSTNFSSSDITPVNNNAGPSAIEARLLAARRNEYELQKIRLVSSLNGTTSSRLENRNTAISGDILENRDSAIGDGIDSKSAEDNRRQQSTQLMLRKKLNGIRRYPESSFTSVNNNHQQKQQQQQQQQACHEYEMLIHPQSIKGSSEAAVWHLHGQTGGRRSPKQQHRQQRHPKNNNNASSSYSVMNARAVMDSLSDINPKRHKQTNYKQSVATNKDTEGDTTNILRDVENGNKFYAAKPLINQQQQHNDQWSTGLAASIVTGTASRYYKSFFQFPHGRRIILPIFISILATCLSVIIVMSCNFMTIVPIIRTSDAQHEQDNTEGGYTITNQIHQVGPWHYLSINPIYSEGEVCLPYPSSMTYDIPTMIARTSSMAASVFGFGLVLWMSTYMCIPGSKSSLNALVGCLVMVGLLELLTAMMYYSENCKALNDQDNTTTISYFGAGECRLNQDLIYCIASSILYIVTGWILKTTLKPPELAMEVYTWSSESKSSNPKRGILRTVEKSWILLPDGSTMMATVFVEQKKQKKEGTIVDATNDGRMIKTVYSVQTEILPA